MNQSSGYKFFIDKVFLPIILPLSIGGMVSFLAYLQVQVAEIKVQVSQNTNQLLNDKEVFQQINRKLDSIESYLRTTH